MTDTVDIRSLRAQERQEKEKRQEKEQAKAKYSLALSAVMGTHDGQLVLRTLLSRAHLYRLSFAHGAPPESVAFFEGERNIGLSLVSDMHEAAPDLCSRIIQNVTKEQK